MALYYAATNGTSGGAGTIGDPWDLRTALSNVLQTSGDTLYLRGGTYNGKFLSTLTGGWVRSYPNEWAKIDGYKTTTLTGAINSSVSNLTVASTAGMVAGGDIGIDTELMRVQEVTGPTTISVLRGRSPSIGGAASHSDGATVWLGGSQLKVTGDDTTYFNFEVTNSWTIRDNDNYNRPSTEGCCGFFAYVRGTGVNVESGDGNKLVNLIVHDNLDGIFTGQTSSNTEVYGVLTYNNGNRYYHTGDLWETGAGGGLYLQNASGFSKVHEVISLNNYAIGAQFRGDSAGYVGGDIQGGVFANSQAPIRDARADATFRNMIFGPGTFQSPTGVVNESHFFQPPGLNPNSYNMIFGYDAGVADGTFTNNYFIGGSASNFEVGTVTTLTATGNKFYSTGANDKYTTTSTLSGYTWDNNTYYNTVAGTNFRFNANTFNNWLSTTTYDDNSTVSAGAIPTTVIVRPNDYETGRGHVYVYAPGQTAVDVDLSTLDLVNGQGYAIKNAFNYFGDDVMTGVYSSASPTISVPLNGTAATVATPEGESYTPDTTAPLFAVLMVIPGTRNKTHHKLKFS